MTIPIRTDSKIIAGISARTTNARESAPDTASIPGLWSRFLGENIGEQISNEQGSHTVYGVYTDYESDHAGAYTLIIGKEIDDEASAPEGMTRKKLPAGSYLKFERAGKLPEAVVETWKEIWAYFEGSTEYQRAYTADYEEYTSEEGVAIYIAVEQD